MNQNVTVNVSLTVDKTTLNQLAEIAKAAQNLAELIAAFSPEIGVQAQRIRDGECERPMRITGVEGAPLNKNGMPVLDKPIGVDDINQGRCTTNQARRALGLAPIETDEADALLKKRDG